MMRYLYTIINTYRYYGILSNILQDKNKIVDQVTQLTIDELNNLHVRVLILDFDGVLNSHGEIYPRADVIAWLEEIQTGLGAENIFILSNKPMALRIQFFADQFPGIRFITGVRKKPYPDGLEFVFNLKHLSKIQKEQVALVDDRVLTGMLAICIAGCQGIYVKRPYTNFAKHRVVESFFQVLRWMERRLFGV